MNNISYDYLSKYCMNKSLILNIIKIYIVIVVSSFTRKYAYALTDSIISEFSKQTK